MTWIVLVRAKECWKYKALAVLQLIRDWLFFNILLKTSIAIEVGEVLGYWYC